MPFADDYIASVLGFTPAVQPEPAAVNARIHQPLTPEEETSQLKKLLGHGASALGFVGGQLDKFTGSRALRGLLGGKLRELLSVIPMSDTLGFTDEADRTSGEDLLKGAGILEGEGTKGEFELRDLAGPALEMVLDPTAWITGPGKALTKAGQAAAKLGATPKTLAGRIRGYGAAEDVAKAMGLGLPEATAAAQRVGIDINDLIGKPLGGMTGVRNFPIFGGVNPEGVFGTGPKALKAADWLADKGDLLLYSAPGRHISAAVDPRVLGRTEETFQRVARDQAKAAATREILTNQSALGVAGDTLYDKTFRDLDPDIMRAAFERVPFPKTAIPYSPDFLDEITQAADRFHAADLTKLAELQAAGGKAEALDSIYGITHSSRQLNPLAKERLNRLPDQSGKAGILSRMFGRKVNERINTRVWPTLQREAILDVPGGTPMLNEMSRELPGMLPADAEKIIRSKYYQFDPQRLEGLLTQEDVARTGLASTPTGRGLVRSELESLLSRPLAARTRAMGQLQGLAPDEAQSLLQLLHQDKYAKGLSEYMAGLPAEIMHGRTGLFPNDPLIDAWQSWLQHNKGINRANLAVDTLARSAIRGAGGVPPDAMKIGPVFKNAGMDAKVSSQRLLDALNANEFFGPGVTGQAKDLADVFVPSDVAKSLTGIITAGEAPAFANPLIRGFDELTKLTRMGLTAPWPGFHMRNLASSFWQNLTGGAGGLEGAGIANQIRSGVDEIPGLAKLIPGLAGMTDREATRALGQQMFATRGAGSQALHPMAEALEPLEHRGFADVVPGVTKQPGLGESVKAYGKLKNGGWNPFNPQFAPAKSGRMVGNLVDDVTRGGMYVDLLKQGYTPHAAAELTQAAHFDYGRNLTDFERRYMRRLVPFYSYQKGVVPQQIGQLLSEPGGIAGQAIRVASGLRQQEGFLPPYLGGGMAIPLGEQEDGTQRYLTKLDLPFESTWELLKPGQGIGNMGMSLLGQLNPLLKGPLEMATNRQFFSGRNLDDLYGKIGLPPELANLLVYNSPLSRAASSYRTATDDRKGVLARLLNLGTGVRLTDVDMNKQAAFTELDLLRRIMRDQPGTFQKFEEFSPRKDALPSLSQDDIDVLRLYRALEKRQRQTAKTKPVAPSGG